jgi:phosphoserine phosphatase RsbU/P
MPSKDLSIIIVDDLQFSRIVVKTALKKAGYNGVRMADSATEALKMLSEHAADVVLADWMMPEMDGLELTDQIRQRDEENDTYTAIILFTADEDTNLLVRAFEHGVDDYLRKPPNPHELAARVNAAVRIATMQNDLLETTRQMGETIKHLEEVAMIDPLTTAGNRRFLISALKNHLLEASSRTGGVCLALFEIDQLADIYENDSNLAEEMLIGVHRRLRRIVRPIDAIARLENDTFAVVMHHTDIDSYRKSAVERIQNGIRQRPFKASNGSIEISTSVGVYYYRGDAELISANEMLKLANARLDDARMIGPNSLAY